MGTQTSRENILLEKGRKILVPMHYNQNKWTLAPSTNIVIEKKELKIMTWNVWFDQNSMEMRLPKIFELISDHNPDVVCLQEVIPSFCKKLVNQKWVKENYYVSDTIGNTLNSYGVLILSKIPLSRMYLKTLDTMMDRSLLVAEMMINNERVDVATVHLESLEIGIDFRRKQLQDIFPFIKQTPHSFFVGDFNFCSKWDKEQSNLDSSYSDVWDVLHPNEWKPTLGLNYPISKYEPARFDRMMMKSSKWKPVEIALFGDKKIGELDGQDQFPSDHLGLIGRFEWKEE